MDSRQGTEGSRVGGFQATRRPIKVDQRATAPRLLTESGGGGRGGRGGGGGAGSSTKGIGRSGLAGSSSNRSSSAGDSSNRGGSARSTSGAACGFELGRWVTPFRRGSGEWLTDVTPLLPLLPTNRCDAAQHIAAALCL